MKYIDLRSDTVSMPTEEMLQSISAAPLGDSVMEEDETVKQLEELGAKIFDKEAALLTPSGTMSNQIAVMVYTQRGEEVIVGKESHMYNLEVSALSALSQVQARPIPVNSGYFDPELVEAAIMPLGIQRAKTGLISMENTYDLNRGLVISPENTRDISKVAKKHGIPLFMDGARIFNAATSLGIEVKELVDSVDSVQVCLTKGLSAPIGSLLVGSKDFIEKAKIMRQRLGGGMRQAGIIAAPAIISLQQMIDRLEQDHYTAKFLAKGLIEIDNRLLDIDEVQSNIVSFDIGFLNIDSNLFLQKLEERGIKVKKIGKQRFRMVTHRQITKQDIKYVLNIFKDLLYT